MVDIRGHRRLAGHPYKSPSRTSAAQGPQTAFWEITPARGTFFPSAPASFSGGGRVFAFPMVRGISNAPNLVVGAPIAQRSAAPAIAQIAPAGQAGLAVDGKRVGGALLRLPGRDENPIHLGCILLNPLTSTRIRRRVAGRLWRRVTLRADPGWALFARSTAARFSI